MRNKFAILACLVAAMPLAADDAPEYDKDLANNKFLVENQRLVKMAEDSLAKNNYDDAAKYAAQSEQYADQSDEYVTLQKKIKDANDAINTAQARMDWAKTNGVNRRYAAIYTEADGVLTQAIGLRSGEKWDEAKTEALRVMTIMAQVPDEIPLPAQYKVKTWVPGRDCLWTIAGKPEVYNDPMQWRRLYAANRQKLPKPDNPNIIEPGMILDIPSISGEFRFGLLEE